MRYLVIDTETTGMMKDFSIRASAETIDQFPRMVQLAYMLVEDGKVLQTVSTLINPLGYEIPEDVVKIHGITTEHATKNGIDLKRALNLLLDAAAGADFIIGHNLNFDLKIVRGEFFRAFGDAQEHLFVKEKRFCTMFGTMKYCAIPNVGRGGLKWPTLQELYKKVFDKEFDGAHDALNDVRACYECFKDLLEKGIINPVKEPAVV